MDLTAPRPEDCQSRCESNGSYKAWTLATRVSGSATNRCTLKSSIPDETTVLGVYSGRKALLLVLSHGAGRTASGCASACAAWNAGRAAQAASMRVSVGKACRSTP